jgi:hypothetical protein
VEKKRETLCRDDTNSHLVANVSALGRSPFRLLLTHHYSVCLPKNRSYLENLRSEGTSHQAVDKVHNSDTALDIPHQAHKARGICIRGKTIRSEMVISIYGDMDPILPLDPTLTVKFELYSTSMSALQALSLA